MINYTFDPNEHTQFNLATSFRFGKNGYSALTWYDGADPRPDYYRYMPSYKLLNATDLEAASMAAASLADGCATWVISATSTGTKCTRPT
jgi:hypothetical protein